MRIKLRYGSMGAVVSDVKYPGMQTLNDETAKAYGGRYFLGESISKEGSNVIIEAMDLLLKTSTDPRWVKCREVHDGVS